MNQNLPYRICNKETTSWQKEVNLFKLDDGRFQVTEWGVFKSIIYFDGCILIEKDISELLKKYVSNQIKLTNIIIFRKATNEEWRNYYELEITNEIEYENFDSLSLQIALIYDNLYVSSNLKNLMVKNLLDTSNIEFKKGLIKSDYIVGLLGDSLGSKEKPLKHGGSIIPKDGGGIIPKDGSLNDISNKVTKEENLFQEYNPSNKIKLIKLYFGTDRNIIQKPKDDIIKFGNNNSELTYGICNVSIPSQHKVGKIERPWLNLKILENESKHIMLKSVNIDDKNSFMTKLNNDINSSPSDSALIFVHGFNVSFVNAAMRTAQISHDLDFQGISSFYSWPSKGGTKSYIRDVEAIQIAESKLKEFLQEVFLNSKAENIYLIGHSMGTRALSKVVGELIQESTLFKIKLKEIILTAPDINAKIFKDEIVPKFFNHKKTITLYASTEDKALQASKNLHGFSRAGESGKNIVVANGVETIDATGMDTGFLKHSYFGESKNVVDDIHNLIVNKKRPNKRMGLQKAKSEAGEYWKFKK